MNSTAQPTRIPIVWKDAQDNLSPAVVQAIADCHAAQVSWALTPMRRRLALVRNLRRLIAEHAPQLAEASASGRSRPLLESLTAEVLPLAEACRFLEREACKVLATRRLGRRGLPLWLVGMRAEIRREPLGIVLIIGPGNYPLLLPGVQLLQALVAGNGVLLKPGVGGTPAARTFHDLLLRAGFDSKLLGLLPESTQAARAAILARPDKVLFTGSAATGENVLAQLAPQLVPATMELSGCDAVIVRADADLDLTVKALTFGLKLNNGATCIAPRRVFVHRRVATDLEGRLAACQHTQLRPSSNSRADCVQERSRMLALGVRTVLRPLLKEALERGAHFIAGDELAGSPIILAGVAPESRLLQSDFFAPVLAVVTVEDDDEAIRLANACPFALGASIFSCDESVARSLAGQLNAGVVSINDLILPTGDARLPFSGRARSGFGVTRGAEGLLDLTTCKVITISRSTFRPAFDSPQPEDEAMCAAYLKLTHGHSLKSRCRAVLSLVRIISRRTKSTLEDNL